MKKFVLLGLVFGLAISFIGCEAAKDSMDAAKDAGADAVDAAKDMGSDAADAASDAVDSAKDMANNAFEGIDFGGFDMKGMQGKLAGITGGFKDLTSDSVGGLVEKISGFTSSIGDMGLGDLSGAAKTAVAGALTQFVKSINGLVDKISDDGIMGKVKPAVEALIEKLEPFVE